MGRQTLWQSGKKWRRVDEGRGEERRGAEMRGKEGKGKDWKRERKG